MFNYSGFLLVRVNSFHYTEIYLKGYRDTHPINVLLMFQLSLCQMVEGGIREQFKWFIPDTDMQRNKARREKGGKGATSFHWYKTVCTLFLWVGPSISSSHLHSWIDLILSKGPQLLQQWGKGSLWPTVHSGQSLGPVLYPIPTKQWLEGKLKFPEKKKKGLKKHLSLKFKCKRLKAYYYY